MIIVFRGMGILALVMFAVMCIPCIATIGDDNYKSLGIVISCIFGIIGGGICIRYGRRWNKDGTEHSLYWVPLQGWGYIIWLFTLFIIIGYGRALLLKAHS